MTDDERPLRERGCGAHHFDDYDPRRKLRLNSSVYGARSYALEQKHVAQCEHMGCTERHVRWEEVFEGNVEEFLEIFESVVFD